MKVNNYEAVVMFYPDFTDEDRNKALDRLKDVLDKHGSVKNVDEWGMRKLAYLIEYKSEAYYVLIDFESDTDGINEFDRIAKIMDPVMRHMIVRKDD
ncbi:MAG: 30S ribosomal protein S6 [Tissierellia bacterium]|nr:30S ribosomal protein S6 [Tissierellia bacterium]